MKHRDATRLPYLGVKSLTAETFTVQAGNSLERNKIHTVAEKKEKEKEQKWEKESRHYMNRLLNKHV